MNRIKDIYRRLAQKKYVNSLTVTAVIALLINLIIETAARHSLVQALVFAFTSPLVFLINACIIFATLSIACLFKRRAFVLSFISFVWLLLGIANGVILLKRMTPFTINDLTMLEDGLSILPTYLTNFEIVLLAIAAVAVIAGFVLLFIKGPKKREKIKYKRNIAAVIVIMLGTVGVFNLGIATGVVDTFFGNLAMGYRDNGVPYSFISTWLDTGIDKPKNYSKDEILGIYKHGELENMDKAVEQAKTEDTPNIIFLQLESFIDPQLVNSIECSEDPIPNFRNLMKNYSSGYFTVPAVGAGTANTEFESITGMSAKFFGPGEYPYKSVLLDKTFESIPYDLKEIGYSTHVIHNHRGVFYNRNQVFKNLGFDDFTSIEYMNDIEKTPKNWAKDSILTDQIMTALNITDSKDYIYTISVEGHGKYPTEQIIQNPEIEVTKAPSEEKKWQYEYYVNMIHSMDKFVKELTDSLSQFDEDVVLVMYGDHLPALDMTEDEMESGSLYNTQYVIWSNFGMTKEDKDLYAYQIGAEVLDRLGLHEGTLVTYHQNYSDSKSYKKNLRALGYDMLYGKQYVYQGKVWQPTDMQMGMKKISIDKIVQIGEKRYIKGHNFTQYSYVTLDGVKLDTTYLSPTLLALEEDVDPEASDRLKVSQIEKYDEILSTTE